MCYSNINQLEGFMYIYHISTEKNLIKIKNGTFCAPLYFPENHNLIHKKLKRAHENLSDRRALYRFCFYSDFNKTNQSFDSDFSHWKSYILRFREKQLHDLGFKWQWDEGFNKGEAHLFWVEEDKTKQPWSKLGIPFKDIEVLVQQTWLPLNKFFPKLLMDLGLDKEPQPEVELEASIDSPEQGIMKKLANKLLKRD